MIAGPADVERRLDAAAEILACASAASDTPLELLGRRLRVVALLEAGAVAEVDEEIAAFAARSRSARTGRVLVVRAALAGHARDHGGTHRRRRRPAATRPMRLGSIAHSDNAAMLTGSQQRHACAASSVIRRPCAFFEESMERWPGLAIMARPGLAYAYAASGDGGAGGGECSRDRERRRLHDRGARLGVAALARHAGLRRLG